MFLGLFGEHNISAIVHRKTQILPDLVTVDRRGNTHPLVSNKAVGRVFKRLADRLQGVVPDTSTKQLPPNMRHIFLRSTSRKQMEQSLLAIEFVFHALSTFGCA